MSSLAEREARRLAEAGGVGPDRALPAGGPSTRSTRGIASAWRSREVLAPHPSPRLAARGISIWGAADEEDGEPDPPFEEDDLRGGLSPRAHSDKTPASETSCNHPVSW